MAKTKLKRLKTPASRRGRTAATPQRGRKGRLGSMKPHEQQRLLSVFLFALSLILLAALTFCRTTPGFAQLADGLLFLFGWSAYPLTLGLLGFSVLGFAESVRRRRLVRYTLMLCSVLFWQLLLIEAQLFLVGGSAFVVLEPIGAVTAWLTWLTHPLFAWSMLAAQGALLTALLVLCGVLFHLRPRHIFKLAWLLLLLLWSLVLLLWERRIALRSVPTLFSTGWRQAIARTAQEDEEATSALQGEIEERTTLEDEWAGAELRDTSTTIFPVDAAPPGNMKQDAKRGSALTTSERDQAHWQLPSTSLLNHPEEAKAMLSGPDPQALARTIQDALNSFRVVAEVRPEDISVGPTVIRFGIRPGEKEGVRTRVSRIMALQNDLALVLQAKSIRMEAPAPARPYVGVEIPNTESRLVTLREVLESREYQAMRAKSLLAMALGRDVTGAIRVGDLARMPHLLIAGATGSGKSVEINAIVGSILTQATPDDVRLLMVDPKMVELGVYNGIPHLLSEVVIEPGKVVPLLKKAITEMEQRYRLFSSLGVRNLEGYRKLRTKQLAQGATNLAILPSIVIIIDELADLMMTAPEEVESHICRLAQLARATGIHLVIATQRPSVDVITGLIKANIPTRIAFMVSSAVDSRTIIDMGGAERLLGRGDMLYLPADAGKPERIQGAFVADEEVERLVAYWKQQAASAEPGGATPAEHEAGWDVEASTSGDGEQDQGEELLEQAAQVVQEYERASVSLLQRRLRIGYSRAARLIDLLEERGIIGRAEPGGRAAREVLEKSATPVGRKEDNGRSEREDTGAEGNRPGSPEETAGIP